MTAANSTGGSSTTSGFRTRTRTALYRELLEKRIGYRGRECLEQVIRARIGDLADARNNPPVVDGFVDRVGASGLLMLQVELHIDEESLPVTTLLLENAVVAVQEDPVKLDRHSSAPASIAAAIVSASTWAATSCTRNSVAPRSNAATAAPIDAASLPTRPSGSPRMRASVLLRETPTRTGGPMAQIRSSPLEQREVLRDGLAEADPGIEAHSVLGDAGSNGDRKSLLEECADLPHDVVVSRSDLHRARLSLHVHQTHVRTRVGDHARECRVSSQRGDVVDEPRAERECPPSDLGLGRVDRNRPADQSLEHGNHASQFLVERNVVRPGSSRLSPDVHESGTLVEQPPRSLDRDAWVDIVSAVREAVWRDVDDSHHRGTRPTLGKRRSGHGSGG